MVLEKRRIRLRPRLEAALEMLRGFDTAADIGCDHGRLACALIQQRVCLRCIATDMSETSLRKAARLAEHVGAAGSIDFRLGDGFAPILPGEAEACALLGMGGTTMTAILEASEPPHHGVKRFVFQPMRAAMDIRRYVYEHGFRIVDDRIVADGVLLYQVFAAEPTPSGTPEPLPAGWPEDLFTLGYSAFAARDLLFPSLARQLYRRTEKSLRVARGTRGEAPLERTLAQLGAVLEQTEDWTCV